MSTPTNYVVLTISGRVWPTKETSYFGILDAVFNEMMSAGGNWDAPWMLLCDRNVVVAEKLKDVAYAYGEASRNARVAAYEKVRREHTPEWLAAKAQPSPSTEAA